MCIRDRPGQVEALETVGICMLVEYMLAPPGAEEPQQLRAFWPDASAATPVPAQNTEVLHDFMFRLFATCIYLCGNQNFTARL